MMIKLKRIRLIALVLSVVILGFVFTAQGHTAATEDALARFPVAHQHKDGWCLGYLYVYPNSIAYETTWPASDKSHSFMLRRSDVKDVGRWSRAGQSLKAVELKSGKSTYHFWWLANEQDVVNGRAYQGDPRDAGDPDLLIAAVRDPATLATDTNASPQTPAPADSTTAPQLQQVPDSPIASLVAGSSAATPSAVPAETRFTVVHAHALLFCVGYLYVRAGNVRYEVVQPPEDKKHAFQLSRTNIAGVQQWRLGGKPRNAAEIRTAHGNYHFWLLADGSDLVNTPYRQWNANNIAPVEPLLTALQAAK